MAHDTAGSRGQRTVLFVDDEMLVLDGLRRLLHPHRHAWRLLFALSGDEALRTLEVEPVDVLVTDMRMPGMDGGRLLSLVRERFPQVARLVLSGHADRDTVIAAAGPTQQFLAKPCAAATLIEAVDQVLTAQRLVDDDELRTALGGLKALPKPPETYLRLMRLTSDPACDLRAVAAVVEQDVTASAEMLRLVNSSFFALATEVDSVSRAVNLLGLQTIHGLLVAGAIVRSTHGVPAGLDHAALSRRGLQVAAVCRSFALAEGWPTQGVQDVFFAGLLCEVGLPALAAARPAAWAALLTGPEEDPWRRATAERAAFGVTVSEATAYLLALWGFRPGVVAAIGGQPVGDHGVPLCAAAEVLTWARGIVTCPDAVPPPDPEGYLTPERLLVLRRLAEESTAPDRPAPA